jgi:hypothetical protein
MTIAAAHAIKTAMPHRLFTSRFYQKLGPAEILLTALQPVGARPNAAAICRSADIPVRSNVVRRMGLGVAEIARRSDVAADRNVRALAATARRLR